MEVTLERIKIRDLVKGYDNRPDEAGVFAYDGLLNVRPPYQREFVYNDKQQEAVIDSILNGFPLNTMYWSDHEDGTYGIIDGQQRTLSICQFVDNKFSYNERIFNGLPEDLKEKVLNYELFIYICTGTESEKLGWFETINIAGEKLTKQELRNAVYTGPWLADAKRHFSKTGCAAYNLGNDYMNGVPIRQDYLQTAISWHMGDNESIEGYMSRHQHISNASELWLYFQNVINWVKTVFPETRREMKGLPWGVLYNEYHMNNYDPAETRKIVDNLMSDSDIKKKSGIYTYIFDSKEKHLNIRAFDNNQKRSAYELQNGICPVCTKHYEINEMEADHITPWSEGGKTIKENCQMLCREDNRRKSNN